MHEAVHQCEQPVAAHEVAREQLEGLQVQGVHKSVHQQECAPRERRLETDMQGLLCFIGVHRILLNIFSTNWCAQKCAPRERRLETDMQGLLCYV